MFVVCSSSARLEWRIFTFLTAYQRYGSSGRAGSSTVPIIFTLKHEENHSFFMRERQRSVDTVLSQSGCENLGQTRRRI